MYHDSSRPVGNSRGNSINGNRRKDERRKAAYDRDAIAASKSIKQKLAELPPDGAHRQRARYNRQLQGVTAAKRAVPNVFSN